jgi:hypothetical protein
VIVLPAGNTEAVLRRRHYTALSYLSLKVWQSAKRGLGVKRVKLKLELKVEFKIGMRIGVHFI